MTTAFVGVFKRAFRNTNNLVAQLFSGTSFFNYNKVGKDSTEYSSGNNIFCADESESIYKKHLIRSVCWPVPGSYNYLVSHYQHGSLNHYFLASPTVSPAIELGEGQHFLTYNEFYVAKFGDGLYAWGGAHIETESSIDYIVMYQLFTITNGFKVRKHRTVLDITLDQTTIGSIPFHSEISYTEDGNFANSEFLYHSNTEGAYELIKYLPRQSRQLVCNNDGTKTIFFCTRRSASGVAWADAEYHPIFEITDTATEFSVTEIHEFENLTTTGIAKSEAHSCSGSQASHSYSEVTSTCPDQSPDTASTTTQSGGMTHTQVNTHSEFGTTEFLGCAYNRFTDAPIVAFYREINKAVTNSLGNTIGWSGSKSYVNSVIASDSFLISHSIYMNIDAGVVGGSVPNTATSEVVVQVIGGDETIVSMPREASYTNITGSATGSKTNPTTGTFIITGNQTSVDNEILDFKIVDLANLLVIHKTRYSYAQISFSETTSLSGEPSSTVNFNFNQTYTGETRIRNRRENIYLYENGNQILLREGTDDGNAQFIESFASSPWGAGEAVCTGDCEEGLILWCEDPLFPNFREVIDTTSTVTFSC